VIDFRAMADAFLWLEALAGLKALYDLSEGAVDFAASLNRHREEKETQLAAQYASADYSTYSNAEIEAILKRIEGCRLRFITQGGGEDRKNCLCSIFKEIVAGNGGTMPRVDDWDNMFRRLNCSGP
jgi:hypothetical protein